jgi:hypothetical protein
MDNVLYVASEKPTRVARSSLRIKPTREEIDSLASAHSVEGRGVRVELDRLKKQPISATGRLMKRVFAETGGRCRSVRPIWGESPVGIRGISETRRPTLDNCIVWYYAVLH